MRSTLAIGLATTLAILLGAGVATSASGSTTAGAPTPRIAHGDERIVPGLADAVAAQSARPRTRAFASGPQLGSVYVEVVSTTPQSDDDTNALSDSAIQSAVQAVSDYWSEESGGAVALVTAGIHRSAYSRSGSTCKPDSVSEYELAHAWGGRFAGTSWYTSHDHLLVLSLESCGDVAFGDVGTNNGMIFSGSGVDSIDGIPTLRHEFGHNFGFGHADSSICENTSSDDGLSFTSLYKASGYKNSTCPIEPYGDLHDIMGATTPGASMHLSALQKIDAGWLAAGTGYQELTAGTVTTTLQTIDSGAGLRALRVRDPRSGEEYVIEYRSGTDEDATSWEYGGDDTSPTRPRCYSSIETANGVGVPITISFGGYRRCFGDMDATAGGVRILRTLDFGSQGEESVVLAVAPTVAGDPTARHSYLSTGQSFHSVTGGFTLTVNSTGGLAGGAQLTVAIDGSAAATKLALSAQHTTPTWGSSSRAVLTAKASSTVTGTPSVAGTVTFWDGRHTIGKVATSTGVAKFTVPATLAVGRHTLRASFKPAHSGYAAPKTVSTHVTVKKARATVTFRYAHGAIRVGARGAVIVSVTAGSTRVASGTVGVYSGTHRIASHRIAKGTTTIRLPRSTRSGEQRLTVRYLGNHDVSSGHSRARTLHVR